MAYPIVTITMADGSVMKADARTAQAWAAPATQFPENSR